MNQYLNLLDQVLRHGIEYDGRNGKVKSLIGGVFRHNMQGGFPAVTTKKLFFDKVKSELIWFLSGSDNLEDLKNIDPTNTIWDANVLEWRTKHRALLEKLEKPEVIEFLKPYLDESDRVMSAGDIYGVQWRSFGIDILNSIDGVDQIEFVIDELTKNPYSRRAIVSAWNPKTVVEDNAALPPCHILHRYYMDPYQDYLNLTMYQRSCDMFLGVPFNIASYGLLLSMMSQVLGKKPGELTIFFDDMHIYEEHYDAVKEQLRREPKTLPKLWLNDKVKSINGFTMEDICLQNYECHPYIKAEMKV